VQDLIKEFVMETKEHLESLEDDFLALESREESPEKELIDNIFHIIHTIKGNAGFFQCSGIEKKATENTVLPY
jgi:two-component system chemotaxis sensor kinase CheA